MSIIQELRNKGMLQYQAVNGKRSIGKGVDLSGLRKPPIDHEGEKNEPVYGPPVDFSGLKKPPVDKWDEPIPMDIINTLCVKGIITELSPGCYGYKGKGAVREIPDDNINGKTDLHEILDHVPTSVLLQMQKVMRTSKEVSLKMSELLSIVKRYQDRSEAEQEKLSAIGIESVHYDPFHKGPVFDHCVVFFNTVVSIVKEDGTVVKARRLDINNKGDIEGARVNDCSDVNWNFSMPE